MQGEAVNKKCIESLIKAGAFDQFEQTRATLMASFENIIDTIQNTNKKSFAGQVTMFDLGGAQEENLDDLKYTYEEKEEYQASSINQEISEQKIVEEIKETPLKEMKKKIFVKAQIHGTYIVGEDGEGMYLIDQHAAQERINYEYFLEKYSHPDMTMRDLLVPITVEYPLSECMIIEERKELLKEVGIYLDPFGNGFIIKQLPMWMNQINEHLFIEDMIQQVLKDNKIDLLSLQEHAIATLSCKASLKGNSHLSIESMQTIVDNLMRCDNPYVCPHGRPTIIHYSAYDLEKLFKRVV